MLDVVGWWPIVVRLVARNVLASVDVVLVSFMSDLSMVRRIALITGDSGPRVHADVVVITLDDHLLSAAVSLAMPITVAMAVAVVVAVTRVGQRGSSTDMNIVVVSFDNHNIVGVFRPVMTIAAMIVVVVVFVAVAWIRERGWRATTKSDMAVLPVDVDVRSRPRLSLCRLLCCCRHRVILVRMMGFVILRISPRQKRGKVFGSE